MDVTRLLLGANHDPVAAPAAVDRRFADPAWRDNAVLRATAGSYVVTTRIARQVLDDADVSDDVREKARFALEMALDALAPTNVPWLNPRVVKELYDTGGLSVRRGLVNLIDDVHAQRRSPTPVRRLAAEGRNDPGGDARARRLP